MQNVTLTNEYHNSQVTLRCEVLSHSYGEVTIRPTAGQIKRAKKELCGIAGCTCSDDAGCRGRQEYGGKRLVVDLSEMFAV